MRNELVRRWGIAAPVLLALACAKNTHDSSSSEPKDAVSTEPLDATEPCAGRGEDIAWGSERVSTDGEFEVTLLQSEPEVPRVGDNVWTLAISRLGQPLDGVALNLSAWMPDHMHGSLKAAIDQEVAPGRHQVAPINFQMPGLWQVAITTAEQDAGVERAVFTFCVTD